MFKAFIDESGIHEGSPVLTVAAYLARQKVWRDWTKVWNVKKTPIRVCHAADAANLTGEFLGWTNEKVAEFAKKLLPLIADADMAGMVIGINMDEYRKAIADKPELAELLGNPYSACFHWIVQTIIELANKRESKERIAFIHETNDYRAETLNTFSWIKKYINRDDRVISLKFGSKQKYTPLQAADILAYEGNKRFRDADKPPRKAWKALKPDDNIKHIHFGSTIWIS
jgi:hypothetical protein